MKQNKMELEEEKIKVESLSPEKFPLAKDVMGESKRFVNEFIKNLQNEGVFKQMGVNPDKTFAIDGPPGVGKTYAIKAINNQLNSHIIKIAEMYFNNREGKKRRPRPQDFNLMCFQYDIGTYGTAYINMGSRRVQQFFDTALDVAYYGIPSLIVCDEADALFTKRGDSGNHGEDKKVLETLMKNIQIAHDTDGVYVILLSNMPDAIDPAVLRAGRIDKRYTFGLPKIEEREKAFKHAILQRNAKAGYCVIRGYNPEILAEMSDNFNYADIYQSVEEAVRQRAEEIIEENGKKIITSGYIKQTRLEKVVMAHKNQFRTDKSDIGFKMMN